MGLYKGLCRGLLQGYEGGYYLKGQENLVSRLITTPLTHTLTLIAANLIFYMGSIDYADTGSCRVIWCR